MKNSVVISLVVSVALLGLCGCASDSSSSAQTNAQPKPAKDNRTREEKLQIGMSMDEVRTALGNPRSTNTISDGSQVWMYNDAEKAFIPNYSLFGGKIHTTIITFDTSGKVKSWSASDNGRY